jgi:hypothetical protein
MNKINPGWISAIVAVMLAIATFAGLHTNYSIEIERMKQEIVDMKHYEQQKDIDMKDRMYKLESKIDDVDNKVDKVLEHILKIK